MDGGSSFELLSAQIWSLLFLVSIVRRPTKAGIYQVRVAQGSMKGVKRAGVRCKLAVWYGSDFCGLHLAAAAILWLRGSVLELRVWAQDRGGVLLAGLVSQLLSDVTLEVHTREHFHKLEMTSPEALPEQALGPCLHVSWD